MERPGRTVEDRDANGDVGDEGAPVAKRLGQRRLQAMPRRQPLLIAHRLPQLPLQNLLRPQATM